MQDKDAPEIPLTPCYVRTGKVWIAGWLYFQNDRFLVLLNFQRARSEELGPIKPLYKKYAECESWMFVIPKAAVDEVLMIDEQDLKWPKK